MTPERYKERRKSAGTFPIATEIFLKREWVWEEHGFEPCRLAPTNMKALAPEARRCLRQSHIPLPYPPLKNRTIMIASGNLLALLRIPSPRKSNSQHSRGTRHRNSVTTKVRGLPSIVRRTR